MHYVIDLYLFSLLNHQNESFHYNELDRVNILGQNICLFLQIVWL